MKRWKIRLSLALNFFVIAILLNTVGIVIDRVVDDYNVARTTAATLEAFKDLTIAIASFLLASYVPRFGYKRTMLAGLFAVMLACMLVAAVTGFWVTPVLYVVVGASFAMMKVAVYSTVGIVTENQRDHTSLMNVLEGVFMVGALTGPLIFGLMIARSHWTNTYWLIAILTALALALLWITALDESEVEEHAEQAGLMEMLRLLKRPLVWTFVICAWLYVMIEQSFGTWMPTFHREIFGLSPALAASYMSLYFGSIALSRFLAGYIAKRISWFVFQVAYLAGAFVVTLVVLFWTAGVVDPPQITSWLDVPAPTYLFTFVGFLIGPIYPTISSIVLNKLPKVQHSPMTGLIIIFSALGGTTGSLVVGKLSDTLSTHDAFYFPLVPIVLLALMLIPYKRLADRHAPATP